MNSNSLNDFFSPAQQYDAGHNPSLLPIVIDRGEGTLLIDTQGHRTIELTIPLANGDWRISMEVANTVFQSGSVVSRWARPDQWRMQ